MSSLTLGELLAFDPVGFAAAAREWLALAEGLDDAAEQLIRGSRLLPEVWSEGVAAQAAQQRVGRVRGQLVATYQPARRIGRVLRQHADGAAGLREHAQMLLDEAFAEGLLVDVATGAVTVPPGLALVLGPERAALTVTAYREQFADLVAAARRLDESTVAAINAELPDAVYLFGARTGPPVTAGEVLGWRGRSPAEVRAWWAGLTPEQQEQAIYEHPQVIGWLDGIPAADRDAANRLLLARELATLQAREDELRRDLLIFAGKPRPNMGAEYAAHRLAEELMVIEHRQAGLVKVQAALDRLGGQGLLLGVDPVGDGRAVISVGNPDAARHAAVWVPGVGTELVDTPGNVNRMVDLQQAADAMTPQANDVATVMWLGYDAPEADESALGDARARQGGRALDSFIDGLRATHAEGEYHLTAMGHSYGSTVVARGALTGDGLAVDDIVVAGSPGMHTDHARDLQIDPRHVWAGRADGDAVAGFAGSVPGVHDNEPTDKDFGANRFGVDTSGHSDYWNRNSESLRNQARIVVGQYQHVSLDHGQPP